MVNSERRWMKRWYKSRKVRLSPGKWNWNSQAGCPSTWQLRQTRQRMRKERQNAGLSAADPVSDVSDVSASCMGKVFSPHIAQIYQTISNGKTCVRSVQRMFCILNRSAPVRHVTSVIFKCGIFLKRFIANMLHQSSWSLMWFWTATAASRISCAIEISSNLSATSVQL